MHTYETDGTTIDNALGTAKMSLIDVCAQYTAEHQAYWYLLDGHKYEGRDDYRAKYHWRRVKALAKRVDEQGKAEGVEDVWEFYRTHR